jgi:hypothetical protein
MKVENRLRNILVSRIQKLPPEKLDEITKLLAKIESNLLGKENTLSLAGSWNKLDDDILIDLTTNLHENRKIDRQID